jgi:hypothetical protein
MITRIILLVSLILLGALMAGACQIAPQAPSEIPKADMPTREATYDDIMPTPGGPAYRANVIQAGEASPLQPVSVTSVVLGTDSSAPTLTYRNSINSKPGQIRFNILSVRYPNVMAVTANFRLVSAPASMQVSNVMDWHGPFTQATILMMSIPDSIKDGSYTMEIAVTVNGKDYQNVSSVINVAK